MTEPRRVVVGITGASGTVYGLRTVEALLRLGVEVHAITSSSAVEVLRQEMGIELDRNAPDLLQALDADALEHAEGTLVQHERRRIGDSPASGSFQTDGMVVVPCSTGRLGSIAGGLSRDLIERAAEVTLKERRRLVVVPRETPFTLIQLRNMATLAEAGATVLPAAPGFYHGPETIDDLVNFVVVKVLDQFGLDAGLMDRWSGGRGGK